jgi:hypothetical protein
MELEGVSFCISFQLNFAELVEWSRGIHVWYYRRQSMNVMVVILMVGMVSWNKDFYCFGLEGFRDICNLVLTVEGLLSN